jgi:putative aldouronate transport system permease protein
MAETLTGRRVWWRRYWTHRGLLLMLVPGVVFFLIFRYLPMYGAIIAFKDYSLRAGVFASEWNGVDNFRRLFASEDFPQALRNTLVISFLRLSLGFAAPIILALLLNEIRITWYKRTVQTLTYVPYFLSWVILGGIFRMLFAQRGPINDMVVGMGGEAVPFLTSNGWFLFVLIITGIWKTVGYGAVIYLAALSSIPPEQYEAAMIDGAGRWKQTLHVTLPALVPTIITLFILSIGHILNAGFDQIFNMYGPLVQDWSDIIDTYVLRRLMTMDFGLATAAGLFKSVVGLILVVTVNSFARRASGGEQGIW